MNKYFLWKKTLTRQMKSLDSEVNELVSLQRFTTKLYNSKNVTYRYQRKHFPQRLDIKWRLSTTAGEKVRHACRRQIMFQQTNDMAGSRKKITIDVCSALSALPTSSLAPVGKGEPWPTCLKWCWVRIKHGQVRQQARNKGWHYFLLNTTSPSPGFLVQLTL